MSQEIVQNITLKGQVAIISGGVGDIGLACALELARRGADIALGDIVPEANALPALEKIRALGRRARYDLVDVSDSDRVTKWFADVEADLGLATLIVPNAAIVNFTSSLNTPAQQWRKELSVNLDGAFFMAQTGAKRLVERKSKGRIVFMGSWAAHSPHPFITTYSVSKAGLRMLCQCMASDLAPHGVLVNEVAPGWVDAGLTGVRFKKFPHERVGAESRIPVGILIDPYDVALQVAHLCEPANKHMTGTVIVMDGGLSIKPR